MTKSGVSRRPKGRSPVIAVRVPPPLHEAIKVSAAAAQHTMSEEMQKLLRSALENRKRFPSSVIAQAVEMATFGLLLTGERYAQENGVNGPWWEDLASRRNAVMAACTALITHFVSTSAEEQALAVEGIKSRVWTHIVSRPKSGFVDPETLR